MLTNKVRKLLKQMCKMHYGNQPDYLTKRQRLYERIDLLAQNGQIGLHVDAVDCDCAHYTRAHVIPVHSHRAVLQIIDEIYETAEGMMSVTLMSPSVAKRYKWTSRDLALEAFEEGHPHVVYYPGGSNV